MSAGVQSHMADTFFFRCPECSAEMSLPRSLLGRKGKCPVCKKSVQVEISAETPAPVSATAPVMEDAPASINHDVTNIIERQGPTDTEQSLGVEETFGDARDSSSSVMSDSMESFGDVVELARRYELQGELGAGGMGKVLKAVDKRLGRTVALKFLHEEFDTNSRALERFLTEAKSIATLSHPNIVQIHELERSAEGPYIVMEYMGGGSLVDVLKKGPVPPLNAVRIVCQVCDALVLAHGKGIIHRDIKPANILLTSEGIPKLGDFGLARQEQTDHGQTQAGAILGTIDFMPPEQRRDATDVDARSDLWSLAATLYQMLTGESPRVIDLDDVPPILRATLGKALKTKPANRFQDAMSFKKALQESLTNPPSAPSQPALQQPVMNEAPSGKPNHCPGCNAAYTAGLKFCQDCGEKLTRPCPTCDVEISIQTKFCGACGSDASALALQGNDFKAYLDRANAYREKGDYQQAMADYKKSLEHWADNPDVYSYRGVMFGKMGQQDDAIADFDRAIQLRANDAVTYNNRGIAYKQKGDFRRALQDLNNAIQLSPSFAEAYSNRGHVYIELGKFKEAVTECDWAIKFKQDYALAYYNRGTAHQKLGNHKQAESDFSAARQLGYQP